MAKAMYFRFLHLGLLCAALATASDVVVVEEIVAKVNGDIVTRIDLERSRLQLLAELEQRKLTGPALEQALAERSKDLLRDRIDQLLLIQKANELSINVDAELSKQMAELQLQFRLGDQDKFQAFIREQTGMSFEDYRAELRNSMLTQRVIRQEVGSRINIPRAEVVRYYEENKNEFVREERVFLREILLSTENRDADAIAAIEKKAQDLVARARKGERFGELARDNSDAVTARNHGDLGGFKRGELRKEIEDVVWSSGRGHVTDPVRLDNGFLILRVEERHTAGIPPIEEVESEIMERLYMPRFQPRIREYLTALRQDAFLEVKEGHVDTSAAPGKDTRWRDPAELRAETITKEEVATRLRSRRMLWMVPIPFTQISTTSRSR